MQLSEIDFYRSQRLSSILLYLTDKCPVMCRHCSVDSKPDSPSINDFTLFEEIVAAITEIDSIKAVGISGGEPFVERRGLEFSVEQLAKAGKKIALYTSGFWGDSQASWIDSVLGKVDSVVLSTDAFHSASISAMVFTKALRRITDAGTWVIIQVIPSEQIMNDLHKVLLDVYGASWQELTEINEIPFLSHGRAKKYFPSALMKTVDSISKCTRSNSPVVRYDGIVTACTNESVIMGKGPNALRYQITEGKQLMGALISLSNNEIVSTLNMIGPSGLAKKYNLDQKTFCNVCDVCWHVLS